MNVDIGNELHVINVVEMVPERLKRENATARRDWEHSRGSGSISGASPCNCIQWIYSPGVAGIADSGELVEMRS